MASVKLSTIAQRADLAGAEFTFEESSGKLFFRQSNEDRTRMIGTIEKYEDGFLYRKKEKEMDMYHKFMAWSIYAPIVEMVEYIEYETENFHFYIRTNTIPGRGFKMTNRGHGYSKKWVVPARSWGIRIKDTRYQRMLDMLGFEWFQKLRGSLAKPSTKALMKFLKEERSRGMVYPRTDEVFYPLKYVGFVKTRVVIIGDMPLSSEFACNVPFSVKYGVAGKDEVNQNIMKVVEDEIYDGFNLNSDTVFTHWMRQGVLPLNSSSTANLFSRDAHVGKGWEDWNREVIGALLEREHTVKPVFILLGDEAKREYYDTIHERANVICAPMPYDNNLEEFKSKKIFKTCNKILEQMLQKQIQW